MRFNQARFIILAALAGLQACTAEGAGAGAVTGPSVSDIAGAYGLKTFSTTTNGVTTDQVAAGVTLTLTLRRDGTTTGRLFVPIHDREPNLEVDMTGTWTVTGDTVRFDQAADTFVRQTPFLVTPGRLEGEATISDTAIRVSLTR